jgi:hypothetical protein
VTASAQTISLVKDPERLENRLKEIPPEPGVYIMRDGSDRNIYRKVAKAAIASSFLLSRITKIERTYCDDGTTGDRD